MINNLPQLINATKSFSLDEGIIQNAEEGRKEFNLKFPLSDIQNLKLDEYCIGTTENSFCYWLEFKKILFGIGGGNASKFGIYKSKDGNYYENSGAKKIPIVGLNLEDRFLRIKEGIVKALKFVEQNEIEKISALQIPIWNYVLLKIFCIYYPDKFLTIGDPDVIIECARNIGIENIELNNENSIQINYLCRKKLNNTPEFSSWGYAKIGTFVWKTYRESAKRNYYIIGSKYGENSNVDVFPDMLARSVIATGFAKDLDLIEYYNEKQSIVVEYLKENNEEPKSYNAIKLFLSLRPGDLIAVKSDGSPKKKEGYLKIIGIAEVVEKNGNVYEYDPYGLGHIINVKYLSAPILEEFSLGGYGRTIHKLSNEKHIKLIFNLKSKSSFYEELIKFLAQSKSNDLRTSKYISIFQELTVKVGFGKGNQARVPWIAFLRNSQEVQNGIYPVYLFYKEKDLLILAYGVSETNNPKINWELQDSIKIESYFKEHNLGNPDRYGSSYVYKVYDSNNHLNEKEINDDLNNLIEIYNQTLLEPNIDTPKMKFNQNLFYENAIKYGYLIRSSFCLRYAASLLTKPFVILTGLSGSGKTKLAQTFAMWICENESQYCIVPVGADWTNREPLLGFPNALESDKYVKPDHKVLDLIINAISNPDKPYFLILDEMNLSHVERYFADFLSVMETNKNISLHSCETNQNKVPKEIEIPKNLFIVGTVNIDETTYMFSPKVLDRANVIEFRVTENEMGDYLESYSRLDLNKLKSVGVGMAEAFVKIAKEQDLVPNDETKLKLNSELINFFKELKKTGAEFGYRSASEIMRFAAVINTVAPEWKAEEIIDAAITQKLLPKVHGSRKKLEPVLRKLGQLCLKELKDFDEIIKSDNENDYLTNGKYPISLEKICRMYKNLMHNGFTSYAEA